MLNLITAKTYVVLGDMANFDQYGTFCTRLIYLRKGVADLHRVGSDASTCNRRRLSGIHHWQSALLVGSSIQRSVCKDCHFLNLILTLCLARFVLRCKTGSFVIIPFLHLKEVNSTHRELQPSYAPEHQ